MFHKLNKHDLKLRKVPQLEVMFSSNSDTKRCYLVLQGSVVAGHDSWSCMAGKFPQKRHTCDRMHKGVRRDSGVWGWVRMGAGGCISTQQAQNKANKVTDRSQGTILTRVCGVEIG